MSERPSKETVRRVFLSHLTGQAYVPHQDRSLPGENSLEVCSHHVVKKYGLQIRVTLRRQLLYTLLNVRA